MLSRASDGTSVDNFLRVKRLTDEGLDLGPAPKVLYLRFFGGGMKAALTIETFLEVTAAWGLGDEVCNQRYLSGG